MQQPADARGCTSPKRSSKKRKTTQTACLSPPKQAKNDIATTSNNEPNTKSKNRTSLSRYECTSNIVECKRRFNQLQDEIIHDTRAFVLPTISISDHSSQDVASALDIFSPFRPTSDDDDKYGQYIASYFSPERFPTPWQWHPCHPILVPNPPPALIHSMTVYEPFLHQIPAKDLRNNSESDTNAVYTYLSLPILPVEEYPISYLGTITFLIDLYCLLSCRKYTVKKASRYSASWTCNGCDGTPCPFSVHITIGKNEIKWNRNKSWVFHHDRCRNVCSWSSTSDPPPPPGPASIGNSSSSTLTTGTSEYRFRALVAKSDDVLRPVASNTVLFALSVICISRYLPVQDVFIKKKEQTSNWRSPWNLQRNKIIEFLKSKLTLNVSLTTNKFWEAMKDVLNGHITYFFDHKNAEKVSIFAPAHYYKKYQKNALLQLEQNNIETIEENFPALKDNLTCPTCLLKVHPRYVIFTRHTNEDKKACFQCAGCYTNNYYCRELFFRGDTTKSDAKLVAYSETVSKVVCRVCNQPHSLQEELSFQNHDHPVWNVHPNQDPQLPSLSFSVPYAWIGSVPTFFPSIASYVISSTENGSSALLEYIDRFRKT